LFGFETGKMPTRLGDLFLELVRRSSVGIHVANISVMLAEYTACLNA
jgi:hypothetical protein